MVNASKKSFIHIRPKRVSRNALLEAIREQRKSTDSFGWVVLGILRDGVEPTAVIVRMDNVPRYYEPQEYDVLAKVEDYDKFLDMHRITRQDQLVSHIYNTSRKWEEVRRKEFVRNRITH